MSEFMGLIGGSYDGKQGGFAPGGRFRDRITFQPENALYVYSIMSGYLGHISAKAGFRMCT